MSDKTMTQKTEGLTAGEAIKLFAEGKELRDRLGTIWYVGMEHHNERSLSEFINSAPFRLAPVGPKQEEEQNLDYIYAMKVLNSLFDNKREGMVKCFMQYVADLIRDEARKIVDDRLHEGVSMLTAEQYQGEMRKVAREEIAEHVKAEHPNHEVLCQRFIDELSKPLLSKTKKP